MGPYFFRALLESRGSSELDQCWKSPSFKIRNVKPREEKATYSEEEEVGQRGGMCVTTQRDVVNLCDEHTAGIRTSLDKDPGTWERPLDRWVWF